MPATSCPHCQRSGTIPDNAVGHSVKCPGCGQRFTFHPPAIPVDKQQPQAMPRQSGMTESQEALAAGIIIVLTLSAVILSTTKHYWLGIILGVIDLLTAVHLAATYYVAPPPKLDMSLQARFGRLGQLPGRTLQEIVDAVGPPLSRTHRDGKAFFEWTARNYRIALTFNGDICEGVYHESFGPRPVVQ